MTVSNEMEVTRISSPAVCQLISLVRASLWQISVDYQPFIDYPPDWDIIGKLSLQQTVCVLAVTSAMSLPSDIQPPKE